MVGKDALNKVSIIMYWIEVPIGPNFWSEFHPSEKSLWNWYNRAGLGRSRADKFHRLKLAEITKVFNSVKGEIFEDPEPENDPNSRSCANFQFTEVEFQCFRLPNGSVSDWDLYWINTNELKTLIFKAFSVCMNDLKGSQQYPASKEMYDEIINSINKLDQYINFIMVTVTVSCLILPNQIVCYFNYFVTDKGNDAFDSLLPVWWV